MTAPVPWIAQVAARRAFKYQPDADERWLRVWEPYVTLRTPIRYEHALDATGEGGSVTIARFVVDLPFAATQGGPASREASAWIAIAQDVRVKDRAAATSDRGGVFAESLDLISVPRQATGDPPFDRVFTSFASEGGSSDRAISPSLRKLVLSWNTPLSFELRPGGFVLCPPSVRADATGLEWLVDAVHRFGEKANKHA